jgi:hypothetical protein
MSWIQQNACVEAVVRGGFINVEQVGGEMIILPLVLPGSKTLCETSKHKFFVADGQRIHGYLEGDSSSLEIIVDNGFNSSITFNSSNDHIRMMTRGLIIRQEIWPQNYFECF